MAALDTLNIPETTASAGAIQTTAPKSTGITGKISLDPTQTESILANMQKYIDERQSPINTFMGGINKARAGLAGPSALTAYQQQQNLEDKQIMDYRTQMAAYRAAQAQAKNDATFMGGVIGGGGAAGQGAAGGVQLGPEAMARVNAARNPTEARAILDEELKALSAARAKGQFDAAGNKQEKYFLNGRSVDMTTNMFINLPPELKKKIEMDTFAVLGYVPGGQTAPAAAAPAATAPAAAAPAAGGMSPVAAVRTIESGNNPNVGPSSKGAVGAMQVLPSTAKQPGFGVKPVQGNAPEEMERVGRDYYAAMQNRYKDDITAAIAYNWGPGNTDRWLADGADPAKLPNETKNYITKFKELVGAPAQTAGNKLELPTAPDNFPVTEGEWNQPKPVAAVPSLPPAPPALAAPAPGAAATSAPSAKPQAAAVPPPVGTAPLSSNANAVTNVPQFNEPRPSTVQRFSSSSQAEKADADWEKRRDAALETYKKFQEDVGKQSAGSFAEAEKAFVTNTDQTALSRRETNTNQLDAWMKRHGENPRILEILSKPEFSNAIADALSQGITTPVGGINIPGIARLVQAGMPGLKQEDVVALKQLDAIMGPRLFEIVKQSKGSSSDKDWAAYTQIAGNANTGYDFLNKAIKYDRVSLKADKADRNLYNSTLKQGQASDYRGFTADPRRTQIYDEYNNDVKNIAAMQHERQKLPPKPANMPKDQKAQWSPSTQSYWIGDTQYKVK